MFNVEGYVRIEIINDASGEVIALIAEVPASDLSYGWSPEISEIAGSLTSRYRIRITSVDDPTVAVESREAFSIPVDSDAWYVDDNSNENDQYTPLAVGNNRATGASADSPKKNLFALLKSYSLSPGDVVYIDTGEYMHVANVILSGASELGDDEGMTVTGPDEDGKNRRDRPGKYSGRPNHH